MKNVVVFAALVFSRKATEPASVATAVVAFLAFCLASSAVYAFNDVLDRREDARHPRKRLRPVASGATSVGAALALAAVLAVAAVAVSLTVRGMFPCAVAGYLGLMAAYALGLKRLAVLDVLILAVGFVLRAYAGALALMVFASPWLILCTLTLALFLGFAKRESERAALGPEANGTRPLVWAMYDEKTLQHMMTVSATLAIATYMLYTVSPETIARVGHPYMFVTVLPVVYGVFRFYRQASTGQATGPVEMVRRDPAFVAALVVWMAMVAALVFGFKSGGTAEI